MRLSKYLRSWKQKIPYSNFHYPVTVLSSSSSLLPATSSSQSSYCSHLKYINNFISSPVVCSIHLRQFHRSIPPSGLSNKTDALEKQKSTVDSSSSNNDSDKLAKTTKTSSSKEDSELEAFPKIETQEMPKISSETYAEMKEREKREYEDFERRRKAKHRQKYMVNSALLTQEFFENIKQKNKDTFLASMDLFIARDRNLRGHVEFIHAALKYMKQFGVHRDLECYKKLLDVFPKGKMVAQTFWQVEFMHYPKQQFCAIDVLEQMEDNGVMGDSEVEEMLANIFGGRSFPSRKHARMMYWMPKFKHLSPFPLPEPLPWEAYELVKLAVKQMTTPDPQTEISIYNTKDLEDAVDHTWIVSGQSPDQQALIESHPSDRPIYVEGAFRVWLRDQCINYFILRAEPREKKKVDNEPDPDDVGVLEHILTESYKDSIANIPSVHEQEDGVILAICGTGTSSRDSLASWIRFLQETNPRLGKDISVIFTLKSPIGPTDNLDAVGIEEEHGDATRLSEKDKDSGLMGVGIGFDPENPDLSQVGVNPLSDTRFVNWPHHFNKPKEYIEEEEVDRLGGAESQDKNKRINDNSDENKRIT